MEQRRKSNRPQAGRQAMSIASRTAQAAGSMFKTGVLRQDRTTPEQYAERLSICTNCPGKHATFKKDGSLNTCGPMMQSLRGQSGGTCGCVLKKKARDASQTCPFGYWPTLKGQVIQPTPQPVAGPRNQLVVPSKQIVVPGQADSGRRRFLRQSIATLAALTLGSRVWANGSSGWVKAAACDSSGDVWVPCDSVSSQSVGDAFKYNGGCYTLTSQITQTQPSPVVSPSDWIDMNACAEPWPCECCEDRAPCECPFTGRTSWLVVWSATETRYDNIDCAGNHISEDVLESRFDNIVATVAADVARDLQVDVGREITSLAVPPSRHARVAAPSDSGG